MIQTCHTWGTWGKVGYPPPGSRLCPARGGAQSELEGWFDFNPCPDTPLTGTGSATYVLGKIPGKFGPPQGGGGWGGAQYQLSMVLGKCVPGLNEYNPKKNNSNNNI